MLVINAHQDTAVSYYELCLALVRSARFISFLLLSNDSQSASQQARKEYTQIARLKQLTLWICMYDDDDDEEDDDDSMYLFGLAVWQQMRYMAGMRTDDGRVCGCVCWFDGVFEWLDRPKQLVLPKYCDTLRQKQWHTNVASHFSAWNSLNSTFNSLSGRRKFIHKFMLNFTFKYHLFWRLLIALMQHKHYHQMRNR